MSVCGCHLAAWFLCITVAHNVGLCGVVGSTLAFGSPGLEFDSGHRYFSHHSASAFSKLRSGVVPTVHDSVRACCSPIS